MLDDNQYFAAVDALLRDGGGLRTSNVLLGIPERYEYLSEKLRENSASDSEKSPAFPMDRNAPDFEFTDDQAGVLARKRGNEILYISFYWRANFGINFLSKVHLITPTFEQMATVRNQTFFRPYKNPEKPENSEILSEKVVFCRPNWTTFGFRPDWGVHYPERWDSLHRAESLPVARIPDSVRGFEPGVTSFYAGRGDEYRVRFGEEEFCLKMSD